MIHDTFSSSRSHVCTARPETASRLAVSMVGRGCCGLVTVSQADIKIAQQSREPRPFVSASISIHRPGRPGYDCIELGRMGGVICYRLDASSEAAAGVIECCSPDGFVMLGPRAGLRSLAETALEGPHRVAAELAGSWCVGR